ncbi:MAG: hypothetical protein ACRDSE_21510, partial [Pseudonocardiaceae bacterium]
MHYSIGWDLGPRERAAITRVPEHTWGEVLGADGRPRDLDEAGRSSLTGLPREGPTVTSWPPGERPAADLPPGETLLRRATVPAGRGRRPAGPVYLVGAREVMEAHLDPAQANRPDYALDRYGAIAPAGLAPDTLQQIGTALAGAAHPVIVTSDLGRDPAAVPALVELAKLLAIPVIESVSMRLNFPADHPLHAGYQWNTPEQNPVLAAADVVLVLGSDVPWIPTKNRPPRDAREFVVDVDPLKEQMPLWHVPAEIFARADLRIAVGQLSQFVAESGLVDASSVADRLAVSDAEHDRRNLALRDRERPGGGQIAPEFLVACLREELAGLDDDVIVLSEAISNYQVVNEHLRCATPGALIGSG